MVGILLVIIASCALNQALAANEWTKVENPLSSDKYRERSSKLFPNTSKINKFLRAELGQFPFHALLNLKGSTNTHFNDCSGSIISYNWILTAAYCIYGVESVDVYVGIVNIDRTSFVWTLNVDRDDLWTHDNFTAQTSRNDIGLIYLASKIPPNEFVSFINLPTRADANQKLVGQNGTIIGYERYKKFLQWEQVAFVENDVCEKSFEITLSESYFCILNEIGAKRGYYGQLGSPLISLSDNATFVLHGMIPYGPYFGFRSNYTAVFTRVDSFLDWIESISEINIS